MDNIHIKTETSDDIDHQPDNHFENVDILIGVKKEEADSQERNEVTVEYYPWEYDSMPDKQLDTVVVHAPYEYDKSPIIKTEIVIEVPKVEQHIDRNNELMPDVKKCVKKKKKKERKNNGLNKSGKPKLKQYHCRFCGKDFAEKRGMDRHTHSHPTELPFECRVCLVRFPHVDQMTTHEKSCTNQRFECYLCRFTSLYWHWNRFIVHFRKHTGDMPFRCKCCKKRFSSQRMLKFHMKYHPKESQSKCSFCQRIFSSSVDAKKHESQCAIQRKWECCLCKSTFTYRSSLLRHLPQHTGQFKFKCKYCRRAFARKDYLEIHQQTQHVHLFKFQCSQCKQGFSQKAELIVHIGVCAKKLFQCDLCTYTTKSKAYARDHKQKHTGSDEFNCLHCSAVFLQRSQLLKHVKIHNKKVPFHCPYCQKVYHRWIILEKHRQKCPKAPTNNSTTIDSSNDANDNKSHN